MEFEEQRRRTAFLAALPACFAGIIAGDTWVHPVAGLAVGPAAGLAVYALTYAYDTWMWRRRNDR
jgi:hypothetical protein